MLIFPGRQGGVWKIICQEKMCVGGRLQKAIFFFFLIFYNIFGNLFEKMQLMLNFIP